MREQRYHCGVWITRAMAWLLLVAAIATASLESAVAQLMPWETNEPIVSVQRELYLERTQPGVGVGAQHFRLGTGLDRVEVIREQFESDAGVNYKVHYSSDNGRNWSAFEQLPDTIVHYKGVAVSEGTDNSMPVYDPVADVIIQPWLRQIALNGLYHNFTYYRLSHDLGRTWSAPKQLKYEAGADFDPNNPTKTSSTASDSFLNRNEAFVGMKFEVTSNGKVVMGVGHANDPNKTASQNNQAVWRTGALNFIGTWNEGKQDYNWVAGNRIGFSETISSRGLMETETAELTDGRILNVWRGSNAGIRNTSAGRKWFSVSTNGGITLSPVQELKYDDGTSFYSPSSMNRLIRHSVTGKLYLIGNISPANPNGNSPRYPLIIAEVDEVNIALKKNTVTLIADRLPGQTSAVQFSNFSLLENPETREIELFLSEWGAFPNVFDADAYKYTLTVKVPGDFNADGNVDAADYIMWRNSPTAHGGDNGYSVWREHFGVGSSVATVAGVDALPEPTVILLYATIAGWLPQLRYRHHLNASRSASNRL